MIEAKKPENEEDRLRALRSYDLLDRDLDVVFDTIIKIAADTCETDISVIALIDRDRQYFVARNGMKARETSRSIAFCAHAILEPDRIFEIPDATNDPRFQDNPLVTGETGVRFYAAQPLVTREGLAIGGLCLLGKKPKSLNALQRDTLQNLGTIIMTLFEARKSTLAAAGQLLEAHDELEIRVEERTRELRDEISGREALEEQLRQAQKMEAVGQLTGGIAHDFNNMLAIIMGILEMVAERVADDDDLSELVGIAATATDDAATLTQRLLAFSRKQKLSPQVRDANALVKKVIALTAGSLDVNIDLKTVLAKGTVPVYVDPGQLENALLNLIVNARDAMCRGGAITIETGNLRIDEANAKAMPDLAPGEYVEVAVSDTGPGMPPEILERVFEPFFTTKDMGRGSGLGLSMVYGFAKQSKGHASIHSEVGKGTTVRIFLPRALSGEDAAALEDIKTPTPCRGHERILMVEDNERVRDIPSAILRANG